MTKSKTPSGKQSKQIEEKRQAPRFSMALHLNLVFNGLDELKEARNISEGGIFITTDQPLPLGSLLKLRISLVHEEIIFVETMGEVMHVVEPGSDDEPGMGIKFTEMNEDGRHFLKEYVLKKSVGAVKKKKGAAKKTKAKKTLTTKKKVISK